MYLWLLTVGGNDIAYFTDKQSAKGYVEWRYGRDKLRKIIIKRVTT